MKKRIIIVIGISLLIILISTIIFSFIKFDTINTLSHKNYAKKKENGTEINPENTKIESVINNINLLDIGTEFPIEEAINQECFVITEDKIYNENILESFIKNTGINSQDRIPDKIRIVVYNTNSEPTIHDLEYKILNEKYIDKENKELNKTGYILITDSSRVHSWETNMDYKESIDTHKITVKDDIPGEFYGINIVKNQDINVAIISLSLYSIVDYVDSDMKQYKDIEIARYILNS